MKTLYLTGSSSNIVVDPEVDHVSTLPHEDRYEIRDIYYIEDPMHVVYQCGERKEEIDARKGDILLVFYENARNKYILDTIKTKQWVANIKNARKLEQEAKEKWAKEQEQKCCDPCCGCECCDKCCADITPEPKPVKKTKKTTKK